MVKDRHNTIALALLTVVLSLGSSSLTKLYFCSDVSLMSERMILGFFNRRRRILERELTGMDSS